MKKTIAIVLSLIFVFAVTSVSFAAEAKKEAAPKAEAKKEAAPKAEAKKAAKTVQVTGDVAAVDAKANTITVKGKKGDVVIAVDDKTKMPKGKTIADVKAGDKVTVKYAEADGKNTAKSVDFKAAKAPKAEAKKAAAPKAEEKKAAPAAAAPAPAKAPEKKKPAAGY
jgi:carnitine O-acetyltransferase